MARIDATQRFAPLMAGEFGVHRLGGPGLEAARERLLREGSPDAADRLDLFRALHAVGEICRAARDTREVLERKRERLIHERDANPAATRFP